MDLEIELQVWTMGVAMIDKQTTTQLAERDHEALP
jgi:hypothetical protein